MSRAQIPLTLAANGDGGGRSGSYYDSDDGSIRTFGRAASAADRQEVAAFVKRYYTAAAAEDGAAACPLLTALLASTVPGRLGQRTGPRYSRGPACATIMSKVFKHFHPQLAAYLPTLEVTGVRLEGDHGLAVLGFRTLPGRQIEVARDRGTWKMGALLDGELP